jgi:hypothetical protein
MILRFVEHRTARAEARAWLGPAVADAREPKLLGDATRLAPAALPRAPAPPAAPAPVPPRSAVAPLVVAEPQPEPEPEPEDLTADATPEDLVLKDNKRDKPRRSRNKRHGRPR